MRANYIVYKIWERNEKMENRVLVVDDMELNRELLKEMLQNQYDVMLADNGKQALELLHQYSDEIAVVLLDLIMPEMDGFAVLERMQQENLIHKLPVIVISGETSTEAEVRCFDYGVTDFVQKPFNASIVRRRVKNVISLFDYQNQLEEKVHKQTETLRKQNEMLQSQTEKLRETNIKIIDILGNVVESRNLESGEHVKRVKGFTRILGYQLMEDFEEYGLTPAQVDMIAEASALHDVGKIAIPDNVLLKPGRLTDEEFELMKEHTTRGCDILNNIEGIWEDDYRQASYEICRHHHERYDGRGYPDHLEGEEIPLSAQIVSIADVYDALVSERVYKKAFSKEEAFQMILEGKCGIFSPKLLEAFRHAKQAFEDLADSNGHPQ